METTENPKMVDSAASSCEATAAGILSVTDHVNGFHYTTDKSESCVIDMESFACGNGPNKEVNQNSRIITRSLSRKGSQRGEKKTNCNSSSSERDSLVSSSSSPRGSPGNNVAATAGGGVSDHPGSPQVHQITVTTSNINCSKDGRCALRRNSFRRSNAPWLLDPKRVLLFFATLSSMGTMLLIYFTLSINRMAAEDDPFIFQP